MGQSKSKNYSGIKNEIAADAQKTAKIADPVPAGDGTIQAVEETAEQNHDQREKIGLIPESGPNQQTHQESEHCNRIGPEPLRDPIQRKLVEGWLNLSHHPAVNHGNTCLCGNLY